MIAAKEVNALEIYRGDALVGELNRTSSGCEIKIDESFLQNQKYNELSYVLKKQNISFKGNNLPSFFAGLLPEGLRLKALVKSIKTSEDDMYSLLASVGSQCIGDIYVRQKGVSESVGVTPLQIDFKSVDFYKVFEDSLSHSEKLYPQESLAGVQEKLSASMISFPLRVARKNKSYILKLNPKDKPLLTQNEFLTLQLAKKCGLKVNSAQLVKDSNNNEGLLVERFDRILMGESLTMVHQEDACQFLDLYPADKYRVPLKNIAHAVNTLATAGRVEVLKLLQLYAFSYLVGNGDLHAKNISLKTDPLSGKVILTDNYDLICTYIYKDRKMALKINGRDDNIKNKDFVSFAETLGLPEKATKNMLDKLCAHFSKNYKDLSTFMTKKEKTLFEKVAEKRLFEISK